MQRRADESADPQATRQVGSLPPCAGGLGRGVPKNSERAARLPAEPSGTTGEGPLGRRGKRNSLVIGSLRIRDALALIAVALICGVIAASPATGFLHGLSLDLLTTLRWHAFGVRHDPAAAPAVVVAIDEETYRSPPFGGSPTVTWTREIGHVLNAIVEGGAKVVGFDIIFAGSIEQSEIPFGEEMLGARLRGFDRDFLRALASAARDGKVVLGEVQHRDEPIRPAPGQRIAVGHQRNIRALNAYTDPDHVVRRLPLTFTVDGSPVPSMAVELAARALGAAPQPAADGALILAGYRIPTTVPNTQTLNLQGGPDDILTFSFADLSACAAKDDRDFFRRHFAGKVVLIGTLLDVEDRKLTSKRFATGVEHAFAPRCASPARPPGLTFARSTISGVYLHATAVNDLIRREAVIELGRTATGAVAVGLAALAAVLAFALTPALGIAAYLLLSVAGTAGATALFTQSLALPLIEPFLAGLAAAVATVGYRFVVVDREERFLRQSFGLYLAPQVIDKMLASNRLPALGGEMRSVTVFFSDVAGFSSIAEQMTPAALVTLMNAYLSAMTDIIEECGGYVDKYIGDSIVAVFGAPADDPDHARNAVHAALRCRARLAELNRTAAEFQGHRVAHRIGLNSGEALVGNIGSRRRFNYTVMSDAVNLASRLEGANKYFGTSIMASEMTVSLTGTSFAWRELDAIRVKGRHQPVRIHEPLAETGSVAPEQAACAAVYAEGLARWRAGDFQGAVESLRPIAESDPPAATLLKRSVALELHPPEPDWEPVFTLEGK
jgi:adenylate cyclase